MAEVYTDTTNGKRYEKVGDAKYNDEDVVVFRDEQSQDLKVIDTVVLQASWLDPKEGKPRKLFIKSSK